MKWQPADTAPINEKILVWGGAGMRFGIQDELGNWRDGFNHRHKVAPKYWMPLPMVPETSDEQPR